MKIGMIRLVEAGKSHTAYLILTLECAFNVQRIEQLCHQKYIAYDANVIGEIRISIIPIDNARTY